MIDVATDQNRHPIPACISTYEKSTGLPASGKFQVRGNIEEWARRDNEFLGVLAEDVTSRDYFDIYLRYWEHYHYNLVLTGLRTNRKWNVVVYSEERMKRLATEWFVRFRNKGQPEQFKVFNTRDRHKEWRNSAEAGIRRVAAAWAAVGVAFPLEELLEAW